MGPWIVGLIIFAVKVYWDPSYNTITAITVYGFSFLVKIHILPCFVVIYLITVVIIESLGRLPELDPRDCPKPSGDLEGMRMHAARGSLLTGELFHVQQNPGHS